METISNVVGFLPALIKATPLTLLLTALAGVFGLVIGTLVALARLSGRRVLSVPAYVFTFAFRGTPLLVQIYLIYYGLGQVLPGTWAGNWKKASLVLTIGADGTVKGRYSGIAARGRWTTKRAHDGDRVCLTFYSIVSDTKCGELFRQGSNVLFGYLNRGKPRLWLRRS